MAERPILNVRANLTVRLTATQVNSVFLVQLRKMLATDFHGSARIVNPDDVSVLAPTPTPTLTLVTCFPFYFVGHAPQRYVVMASLKVSSRPDESANKNSISTGKKNNKKEKQDEVN